MEESKEKTKPETLTAKYPYETPVIKVMDEEEVLSAFQVPVVATTWWIM